MLNRRSIRIKVLQHIYSYEHNVGLSDDIDSLKSHTLEDLKKSISNIDSFLYQLLSLSLSFREIDSRKRELNEKSLTKKNKLKFNFSNNKVLEFLGENEKIKSEITFPDLLAVQIEAFESFIQENIPEVCKSCVYKR